MDFLIMDFVKIEQWNSLHKNVRKREDINWWVVAITLPEEPLLNLEVDKRKFFEVWVTTFRQAARLLIISWGRTSTWTKQPHTCTIKSPKYL